VTSVLRRDEASGKIIASWAFDGRFDSGHLDEETVGLPAPLTRGEAARIFRQVYLRVPPVMDGYYRLDPTHCVLWAADRPSAPTDTQWLSIGDEETGVALLLGYVGPPEEICPAEPDGLLCAYWFRVPFIEAEKPTRKGKRHGLDFPNS